MNDQLMQDPLLKPRFHAVRLLLVVLSLLLLVFWASGWYANRVSLPRYCEQTEKMLRHLLAINQHSRPAGDNSRREYIVAAKLEFLLPRAVDEPVEEYIQRLQSQLADRCR